MNIVDNRLIADISNSPLDLNLSPVVIVIGIFCCLGAGYLAMQFNAGVVTRKVLETLFPSGD